jgi:coenzyme PQQ precursor peptide PqqA
VGFNAPCGTETDVEPVLFVVDCHLSRRRNTMNWTTPTLVEICIGLEINGYLPAEF